jgi:hypothetical protein
MTMSTAADCRTNQMRGGALPPSKIRRPAAPTHAKENEGEAPSMMSPDRPEFGEPDPALFTPLTTDENHVLRYHLTSGWYKQSAVFPPLSGIWRETSEILDDMHQAWNIAFDAEQRARATCRSCGASGAVTDLEKHTVRSLADGAERDEWQCTDRQSCAARFAPGLDRVLAAGGAR